LRQFFTNPDFQAPLDGLRPAGFRHAVGQVGFARGIGIGSIAALAAAAGQEAKPRIEELTASVEVGDDFWVFFMPATEPLARTRALMSGRWVPSGMPCNRLLDIMDKLFFIQNFSSKKPLGKPDRHPSCAPLSDGRLALAARGPAGRRLEDDVDWNRMRDLPKKG
jgi:hypothetical protein